MQAAWLSSWCGWRRQPTCRWRASTYLLPTAADVAVMEYGHIQTASARPGGFKGMGEGGAIGAPAAVFNAIADALAPLGVVLTDQPLTPSALVQAIAAAATR